MEFEEIQTNFKKKRNLNEINDIDSFLKYSNTNYSELIKIKDSLELDNLNLSNSKNSMTKNKSANDLNDLFDKINKKVLQQEWGKLPNYIQNDKLREYVNSLPDIEDTSIYYKELLQKIKSKEIKKKNIIYNSNTCIIENIII